MQSFQEVNHSELKHIEGGMSFMVPLIVGGIIVGGTVIAGAYLAGKVTGATSDECKKPQ
jgi:bacteriocin-like protein